MWPTGWESDSIIPVPLLGVWEGALSSKAQDPPGRHWEQAAPQHRIQDPLRGLYPLVRRHSIYGPSRGSSNILPTKWITFLLPKPGFFSGFQQQPHPRSSTVQRVRKHPPPLLIFHFRSTIKSSDFMYTMSLYVFPSTFFYWALTKPPSPLSWVIAVAPNSLPQALWPSSCPFPHIS